MTALTEGFGSTADGERLRPTPLETAAGLMLGIDPYASRLPDRVALSPQEALRISILTALRRPPCVVAFSGGRDSSAVLALATNVAREEGLPLPVPVTLRFAGVPEADESRWQEMVIRHLDLDDWVRAEAADDLDYVGPWAQRLLLRHGVLWPANTHVDLYLLQYVGSGSLVDGVDGDSIFSWRYLRLAQTLKGRRRPGRTALHDLRFLLRGQRGRVAEARRFGLRLPWLTPSAQELLLDQLAVDYASEPLSYAQRAPWYHGSRYLGALEWTTSMLAAEQGALVVRPLLDDDFLVALGQALGRFGFRGRTAAMRWLFGDMLPEDVIARQSKASFPQYWGLASRELATTWSGEGVDDDYVDHHALARLWSAAGDGHRDDHRSALLLQSAWLARHA